MTIEELKTFLSNLTVVEAAKLAKDLEDAWGIIGVGRSYIRGRASTAYGAPMPRRVVEDGGEEIPFATYYLTGIGDKPIFVMKTLRQLLGWDLGTTKRALALPRVHLYTENKYYDEKGKELVTALEELGATVVKE